VLTPFVSLGYVAGMILKKGGAGMLSPVAAWPSQTT
jgi:hypothetical protein